MEPYKTSYPKTTSQASIPIGPTTKAFPILALELSFIPKLQDFFADFPNLRYSITRGFEPLRPDVEMSTDYLSYLYLGQIFKDQALNLHTQENLNAFRSLVHLSLLNAIPGF